MDERRSLALLGWTVGGIVGLMFTLNAIALCLAQGGPPATRLLVSHAGNPYQATLIVTLGAKPERS
jgi:hypothetical protein